MKQPSIAVISYNTPHRKTQDVLFQLKAKGYENICVLALPFVKRENPFQPIFAHRPSTAIQVETDVLCKRLNYDFQTVSAEEINDYLNQNKTDFTLIAGRSEEHTSELQSRGHLVCRLLLEIKKTCSKYFGIVITVLKAIVTSNNRNNKTI